MHHPDPDGSRNQAHREHDPSLIAAYAADDLTAVERSRAVALTDACADCAALLRDLLAIVGATRALPPIAAPRDFRITADQAARLRPTGWLATLLAPFAAARSAVRPIATAFTTLGLAGLFVAAVAPGMLGGMAPMAAPEGAGGAALGPGSTEAPVPQFGPAGSPTVPDDKVGTTDNVDESAAPGYVSGGGDNRNLGTDGGGRLDAQPSSSPLVAGSVAFLVVGLLLFGLRFASRRLR